MNEEPKIDIERDEYGYPPGGYGSWAGIATDRKTNQIADIWMGGRNVPTRHYTSIPVYVKPNMEILLCWNPDRLVIRQSLPQNDFPNTYTERTHILVQNKN